METYKKIEKKDTIRGRERRKIKKDNKKEHALQNPLQVGSEA